MASPQKESLLAQARTAVANAKALLDRARNEGRAFTAEEKRKVEENIKRAGDLKTQVELLEGIENAEQTIINGTSPDAGGSDVYGKFLAKGFVPGGQAASIPFDSFGRKAFSEITSLDDLNRGRQVDSPEPADRRFAYPAFPMTPVPEGQTSVEILRGGPRTLASPASMVRAIDAVTGKPVTSSARELASVAMQQVATISDPIPRISVANGAGDLVRTDLRLAFERALDTEVLAALEIDGVPATTGATLAHTLAAAVEQLSAEGYNADTLILRPNTATAIALYQSQGPEAMFSSLPIPAGLRLRISSQAASDFVVDSSAAGRLFASPVRLDSDESGDNFTQNTVVFRLENHSLFEVLRAEAIAKITGGS